MTLFEGVRLLSHVTLSYLYVSMKYWYLTVRTTIVDPLPIEDPSLKIQIEDLFLFSKNWV